MNNILADTTKSLEELKMMVELADKDFQISKPSYTAESPSGSTVEVMEKMKPAHIKYSSYDSLRCVANVTVSGVQKGSESTLSTLMDGSPISEIVVKRDASKRVSLRSGIHEYEFAVENAAGRNSVKKVLGCFPMKPFSVKVFGGKNVRMQIPPPPPEADDVITQTLQFQIRVSENDPIVLNKVTVRQNGKVILQERLSQIQNLDYQIPVELKRGIRNRFDIEVVHKSGYVVKTVKVYEVSK